MEELYPTVSDEMLREYLNRDIIDDVYDAMFNFSAILGDKNGWLTKPTAILATKGLVIDARGRVEVNPVFDTNDLYSDVIKDEPFDPEVSYQAYQTYLKIKESDEKIVLPIYTDDTKLVTSPLLKYSDGSSKTDAIMARALYVELYHVYLELLHFIEPSQFLVTRSDLQRMDANIRWLCSRVEGLTTTHYDLVEVLRDLQINLTFIRNLDKLFEQTKSVEMELLTGVKNMEYKQYTVVAGDSLPMIAQRLLEDASRWIEIATLNDLEYPYISTLEESLENTVVPGDVISVPILNSLGVSNIGSDTKPSFGNDLLLTSDRGNLSFGWGGDFRTDSYGDLVLALNEDSLAQDLMHRLMTPFGSLPYHPEYGSWFLDVIGSKNDTHMADKAVIELLRTFRSDPRVQDVINVEVRSEKDVIRIECDIVTQSAIIRLREVI